MSSPKPKEDPYEPVEDQYTVGWICALQQEYEVAYKMLDKQFKGPRMSHPRDDNTYEFGQIADHYVVIGCLPFGDYGTNSAAAVAKDMVRSFPKLRFALLVGIGAGAPTKRDDIRLGDVVVGASKGIHGGIVQLDAVKRLKLVDGSTSTRLWRHLNGPPNVLLGTLAKVQRQYNDPEMPDMIDENIKRMAKRPDFERPSEDRLYRTDYPHQGGLDCDDCDIARLEPRAERAAGARVVKVHYGTIGSSNSLMRVVDEREQYANDPDLRILCFEMEAAGLVNSIPCLVIRGISDYADSHKNDEWHNYAALTAAAYTRELLHILQAEEVTGQPGWINFLDEGTHQEERKKGVALSRIAEDSDMKWHYNTHANYYSKRHPGTGYRFETHPEFLAWVSGQAQTLLCHGPPGAVIDALDECLPDVREALLKTMIGLQDRTSLRVMVTSRGDFRSIEHRFTTFSKIEIKAVNEDVQAFIKDGVKHIRLFENLGEDSSLRDDIPRRVAQAAGSLFLVAKFQLDSLRNINAKQDVDDLLGKGPKGLKRVYDESIERIDQFEHTQRHCIYSLLSWVFQHEYANPMTIGKLEHALSVQEGDIQFNQKRIPDVASVISQCGGLVSFNNRENVVEFAHETVQQYFKDNPNIFEKNFVTQRHLALKCITYLSCAEPPQSRPDATPFYFYAANSWGHHVRHADPQTEVHKLILDFLENETKLSSSIIALIPSYNSDFLSKNWLPEKPSRHPIGDTYDPKMFKGLHLAAYFGLKELANYLLDNGADIEATTRNGRTPLHYAVLMKHDEMVRLLAQRGANVNTKDKDGSTPLHKASNLLSKPLMEVLIRKNANMLMQDQSGDTPLHELVKGIYLRRRFKRESHVIARGSECMELLIKSGVDLNFEGRPGRTILREAIIIQNEVLVKQLLDAGAALDADSGVLALSAKEKNKLDSASKMVLEYIAAVPVQRDRFAVYTAAIKGQHDEVKRLLDMDETVIETDDPLLQIALSHSARKGHCAVMQVLLEAGVDCNAVNHGYEPALLEAAENGHDAAVRILLKAGADIKTKNWEGKTALHTAVERGHEAIVHRLMTSKANIHARCNKGTTPLSLALRNGQLTTIRLLRGNLIPVSRRRKRRASDDLIRGIQDLKI
ncbi:hypothetical protein ABKA04_002532 [Annulohypoxylon sp. FPYF3050]